MDLHIFSTMNMGGKKMAFEMQFECQPSKSLNKCTVFLSFIGQCLMSMLILASK
jgi:hypothetical protein